MSGFFLGRTDFIVLTPTFCIFDSIERRCVIHDSFKTIRESCTFELKEKGSRFIAQASPVADKAEAEDIIRIVSKKYHDATHNCFAYIVGVDVNEKSRFNDDGEPSGTAGKPILQAIQGQSLTNVLVIVTRYFGGTKLGVGGLIRAYGGAAAQVLSAASVKTCYITDDLRVACSYHDLKTVLNAVQKYNGKIVNSDYGSAVQLELQIILSRSKHFVSYVVEQTAGRVTPIFSK